jgi:hypothetical protein
VKTLLNGVNEVLMKVQKIDSGGLLSSLTDRGRQTFIDLAVQSWNEAVDDLYSQAQKPKPFQMKTDSIILVENNKDYELADDLEILYWPLHDETNGQYIHEYPGGWTKMQRNQPQPENYTGTAYYGAIHPETGKLYIDRAPTSNEANRTYYYDYARNLELTLLTDQFPFSDTVFRAMVPVVAQLWRRYMENTFDEEEYKRSVGRASRMMIKVPQRTSWITRQGHHTGDPLSAD